MIIDYMLMKYVSHIFEFMRKGGITMDILKDVIQRVPDYSSFMTVDELNESSKKLAKDYPSFAEYFEIGRSRDNNPIYCLKIGKGSKKALLYAFPHPNEPVGSMMLEYLSEKLVIEDALRNLYDFTWFIVKVADPDGAKLNEGWFKNPYSYLNYVFNYYRPAGNQQVEWSFPIEYKTLKFDKPIPETKALMNIIETEKPDFIYSLHNAGFGGVYYYITEESHILYPIYQKIVKDLDLPMNLGEPETPAMKKIADAIYSLPTTEQSYDYYEKYSDKDPAELIKSGESSYGYSKKFNSRLFELVCEVPYYYDSRIENVSLVDKMRRELVLKRLNFSEEDYKKVRSTLESVKNFIVVKTRFQEALEYFLEVGEKTLKAEKKWAETSEELNRKATVAEEFDNLLASRTYELFKWGLLRRMLIVNYEKTKEPKLNKVAKEVSNYINKNYEELKKQMEFNVIPVKKLVQVQLAAGLYSALYVQGR
jgi:hypothetical protein